MKSIPDIPSHCNNDGDKAPMFEAADRLAEKSEEQWNLMKIVEDYIANVTDEQFKADLKASGFDEWQGIGNKITLQSMQPQAEVPTINITAAETDPGWRRIETNEPVKTYHQCYYFAPQVGWRLSSFWTVEEYRNRGVSNYRSPTSLKAWLIVFPQLVKKVWQRVKRGGKLP